MTTVSVSSQGDEGEKKRGTLPDKRLVKLIAKTHNPSRRMEDQRSRMPFTDQEELFMDLVGIIQSRRMDDQRASLAQLPSSSSRASLASESQREPELVTEEEFVELLFRCQVRASSSHHP